MKNDLRKYQVEMVSTHIEPWLELLLADTFRTSGGEYVTLPDVEQKISHTFFAKGRNRWRYYVAKSDPTYFGSLFLDRIASTNFV